MGEVLAYACQMCGRVAKTERELLAQGCEGRHEPLALQAENQRLREAGDALAGQLQVARGGLGGVWHTDALDPMEAAIATWREATAKEKP